MNLTLTALTSATSIAVLGFAPIALAQTGYYNAGQAVGGQQIKVDLNSISEASGQSVNFTYYLGNSEPIYSQAHCYSGANAGTWTTFDDGSVHRPQSQATQNMLNEVCSYLAPMPNSSSNSTNQTAYVFDPPSNVRETPNGKILCSINRPTNINVYGHSGDWYYTDACGRSGVIFKDQIQF